MSYFETVKTYILELGFSINAEDEEDGVLVVSKDDTGIQNMVLGIAEPILIFEQYLFDVSPSSNGVFKELLKKNRDIIHGAFVLDDSETKIIFRDTLQLENLDLNEVEGTFNSLALLLTEYTDEIIEFSK